MWLNTLSLNTLQFCRISTNDAPWCSYARFKIWGIRFWWVSTVRATNRPPAPRASAAAEIGFSTDPLGVEGDRVPRRDVGEYWPFVSP